MVKHTSALDCMATIVSMLMRGSHSAAELAEAIDTNTVTIRSHLRALHRHGVARVSGLAGTIRYQTAVWSLQTSPPTPDIQMPGYVFAFTFKVPHPPKPPRVRKPRVKVKVEKPPKPPKPPNEPKPKVKRVRKSRAKPKELHKVRASKARVWPPGPPRAASIFQLGDIMKESMQCEN